MTKSGSLHKKENNSCEGVVGNGFDSIVTNLGQEKSWSGSICNPESYNEAFSKINGFINANSNLSYKIIFPQGTIEKAQINDAAGNLVREALPDRDFFIRPVEGSSNTKRIIFKENIISPNQSIEFSIRI